jgi:signal transduction histidine kinase
VKVTQTGAAVALTMAAVLIPCGAWYWLGSRQLAREAAHLDQGARREASFVAKQLATRLAVRLEDLLDEEGARPAVHYSSRYLDWTSGRRRLEARDSPLSLRKPKGPVLSYFQVNDQGRVTGPFADKIIAAADLASIDEPPPPLLTSLLPVRPATEWAALPTDTPPPPTRLAAELPRADDAVETGRFHWHTGRWKTKPTLVAMRRVEVGEARYTQGFAVDSGCLSHWLFGGSSFPARLAPGAARGETDAAVPIAGAVWHVSVDAGPALSAARTQAQGQRRQFHQSYAGGLLAALLAGASVVALVWRSGKLAGERSRFAAAAAHELRTPLAGIRLHGEMLAHSLGNPARVRQYAQRIADEAERLGRLVANVLAHTQVEQSRLRLAAEAGDLGLAVRDGLALLEPMVAATGAVLLVAVEEGLPLALFDRDAAHQIVRNLVDNAEKYTRGAADRRIEVEVNQAPGGVAVVVRDHGPGVTAAQRPHLFRPFSPPAADTQASGLGLGLAVVRSLAIAQDATLALSDTPGGGATFTVTFAAA